MRTLTAKLLTLAACASIAGAVTTGCEPFDAPPQVAIANIQDGILPDPSAPVTLTFHEPIVDSSLDIKVAFFETDGEGNLGDEDTDDTTELRVIYSRAGDGTQSGGLGTLDATRTQFTIDFDEALPVGPQLVMLIEPGLSDDKGNSWKVRQYIRFGYGFECDPSVTAPTTFPETSVHFVLVDVETPIGIQLQLFGDMRVDQATGAAVGQFTNADRDASIDCTQFGLQCTPEEVCRTLPTPSCAMPSDSAASVAEYPDYIHFETPPRGYSFTIHGCVRDVGERHVFANYPASLEVIEPPVGVEGINFNTQFEGGAPSASGTFTAERVIIGTTDSGSASGSIVWQMVPPSEVKPGLPPPDAAPGDLPPEVQP